MTTAQSQRRSRNKISWSRNGFIAYSDFSPSTNLSITKLQSIKGSSWRLSPKRTYQIKPNAGSKLNDVKYLQWSNSGSELAVIDEIGNLTVLGTGICKTNSNGHQASCFEDIEIFYQQDLSNEMNSNGHYHAKSIKLMNDTPFSDVLSFKWLNVDKPVIYSSPAVKTNEDIYNYTVHQYKPYGVIHPIQGKSGGFLIRRNGSLSFYYQTLSQNIEFQKVTVNLENDGETLIDDASIGFNRDGSVTIVTFSSLDHSLKSYKVSLDWGNVPHDKLSVTLKIDKLITERINKVGENGLILDFDSVEVISSNFSLDTELDILLTFTGPGVVKGKTLLQKYQISNEFDNLRFKNEVVSVEAYPNLKLIDEIVIPQKIANITTKNFDFLLVLALENGEIQVRSRKTLSLHTNSHSSISSLLDAGYHFETPPVSPETVAISPCLSGYVSLRNGELKFQALVRPSGNPLNEEEKLAVSAAVSYLFASACFTNTEADELVVSVQRQISNIKNLQLRESLVVKLLEECHRGLNFSLDFSKDQIDRLLVNPPIQRLLSFQYSLGKYSLTNEQSSIALCMLNLRLVSFSVMLSLRTFFHQQQRIAKKGNVESLFDSIHRSENLLSTIGTINWFIDFLIFALQEFIKISTDSSHKSIVMALFLAKIPRSLMIYAIAGIKRIEGFLAKVEENYQLNKQQIPLNMDLFHTSVGRFKTLSKLVDLNTYEAFLTEIETILAPVSNNNNNTSTGLKIEQELVFLNRIPSIYQPFVSQLLTKFQEKFMNLDLSNLFLHDTTWLDFQIKPNNLPSKTILSNNDRIVPFINLAHDLTDDVTKTKILKKEKLKRCARCEYITSGSNTNNSSTLLGGISNGLQFTSANTWPVAFQRTCICGNCWIYVSEDEIFES